MKIVIVGFYHGIGIDKVMVCGSSKDIAQYALDEGFEKVECPQAVMVEVQHLGLMRFYDAKLPNMNMTMPLALFNEDIVAVLSKKI